MRRFGDRDWGRDLQPGEPLLGSPYRVVRLVGAGGMGCVYEVSHEKLDKRYIAKTLHARLRSREDLVARMELEAKTLAKIAHPNIVDVHHLDVTTDGVPYFIMDKLRGVDLRKLLRSRTRLDADAALGIILDVLEALAHAHLEGVVHRDIKPENIFLAQRGVETVTKLLDFGVARVISDGIEERRLTGDYFIGTLQYAAPEQLRGDAVSELTDVYSVGCVLFEMLAGRGPFDEEEDPNRIAKAHATRPAPLVSDFVDVPPEVVRAIARALEKDPHDRMQGALAFAGQLRGARDSNPRRLGTSIPTEETLLKSVSDMAPGSSARMRVSEEHPRIAPTAGGFDAALASTMDAPDAGGAERPSAASQRDALSREESRSPALGETKNEASKEPTVVKPKTHEPRRSRGADETLVDGIAPYVVGGGIFGALVVAAYAYLSSG